MIPKTVIISRTDSIGDVMLTLPMCGILKEKFPGIRIIFLGRNYTEAIAKTCVHIDEFLNWDELSSRSPLAQITALKNTGADTIVHVFPKKEILWVAKRAGIAQRIATAGRIYTIGKCNKLVFFSRKKSDLHEAQLNLKLLKPLGIETDFEATDLAKYYGFTRVDPTSRSTVDHYLTSTNSTKRRIIFHPLSKGSATEWSLHNYQSLLSMIDPEHYDVFITGTAAEGEKIRLGLKMDAPNVFDVTGRFSLSELIAFIQRADVLVAASTGPLHIAAALGVKAVGLYSPRRPMHPGRWAPLGEHARWLMSAKHPLKGETLAISPDEVLKAMLSA